MLQIPLTVAWHSTLDRSGYYNALSAHKHQKRIEISYEKYISDVMLHVATNIMMSYGNFWFREVGNHVHVQGCFIFVTFESQKFGTGIVSNFQKKLRLQRISFTFLCCIFVYQMEFNKTRWSCHGIVTKVYTKLFQGCYGEEYLGVRGSRECWESTLWWWSRVVGVLGRRRV